jgi:isopentenyl-diphosphate delta-isomerase
MTEPPDRTLREPSSDDEFLIVVDETDRILRYERKRRVHDGAGILHRAFSIFLFDEKKRFLLQRRSAEKRLFAGLWSNTCCGHPRRGESNDLAAERRLREELGVAAPLVRLFSVTYRFTDGEKGTEHELGTVHVGPLSGDVRPDPREVAATRLATVDEVTRDLAARPGEFTPWFRLEWPILLERHARAIDAAASERP